MSQLNVNIIKNEAGTAGPTLFGDVTITGSINTSGIITASSFSGNGSGLTGVGGTSVFAAGTAAAPSISPTGDSNTGIFFPAADTIAASTGGAERVRITAAGLVGIGTTSPAGALEVGSVSGNVSAGDLLVTTGSTTAVVTVGRLSSTGSDNTRFRVRNRIDTTLFDVTQGTLAIGPVDNQITLSTNGSERARIDSSGRLLVGTTSNTGANLLQVNSDARINGYTVGRGGSAVSSNTAVGASALAANIGGYENTAIGYLALSSNTSAINNTACGSEALKTNTTGAYNTAIGTGTLRLNVSGAKNTAVGTGALRAQTGDGENTAIGNDSSASLTIGYRNTSVGERSLNALTDGSRNTTIGNLSQLNATTGSDNTSIGYFSLGNGVLTGNGNTGCGTNACRSITSGSNNSSLGNEAGYDLITGSNNIMIGYNAQASSTSVSNTITFGNSSIATLRCQVTTITALSDARDKTNITNLPAGLDFINALRPVAFDWNMRDGGKVGIHEFGFIAQELQEVQASTGITVPNLVSTENPDKLEASPGVLLPILINAVKQLSAQNAALEARLAALETA